MIHLFKIMEKYKISLASYVTYCVSYIPHSRLKFKFCAFKILCSIFIWDWLQFTILLIHIWHTYVPTSLCTDTLKIAKTCYENRKQKLIFKKRIARLKHYIHVLTELRNQKFILSLNKSWELCLKSTNILSYMWRLLH